MLARIRMITVFPTASQRMEFNPASLHPISAIVAVRIRNINSSKCSSKNIVQLPAVPLMPFKLGRVKHTRHHPLHSEPDENPDRDHGESFPLTPPPLIQRPHTHTHTRSRPFISLLTASGRRTRTPSSPPEAHRAESPAFTTPPSPHRPLPRNRMRPLHLRRSIPLHPRLPRHRHHLSLRPQHPRHPTHHRRRHPKDRRNQSP